MIRQGCSNNFQPIEFVTWGGKWPTFQFLHLGNNDGWWTLSVFILLQIVQSVSYLAKIDLTDYISPLHRNILLGCLRMRRTCCICLCYILVGHACVKYTLHFCTSFRDQKTTAVEWNKILKSVKVMFLLCVRILHDIS